jgi:hypothetical protein
VIKSKKIFFVKNFSKFGVLANEYFEYLGQKGWANDKI